MKVYTLDKERSCLVPLTHIIHVISLGEITNARLTKITNRGQVALIPPERVPFGGLSKVIRDWGFKTTLSTRWKGMLVSKHQFTSLDPPMRFSPGKRITFIDGKRPPAQTRILSMHMQTDLAGKILGWKVSTRDLKTGKLNFYTVNRLS